MTIPQDTTPLDSEVTVGATSTAILAAHPKRLTATIVNDSNEPIYVSTGGAAVVGQGIRLNANGGSYEIHAQNIYYGAINGICASGSKDVSISQTTS